MKSSLFSLASAALVAGHGQVFNITVNDKLYEAWSAYTDPHLDPPPVRYTRAHSDQGFVPDFTTPDITYVFSGLNDRRLLET